MNQTRPRLAESRARGDTSEPDVTVVVSGSLVLYASYFSTSLVEASM